MIQRIGLAYALTLMVSLPALAETQLICENPIREYQVVYSPGVSELILNPDSDPTSYVILIDEAGEWAHVITAATPNGGPTARLHLRPYLKMEFWSDGELFQTDGCYRKK